MGLSSTKPANATSSGQATAEESVTNGDHQKKNKRPKRNKRKKKGKGRHRAGASLAAAVPPDYDLTMLSAQPTEAIAINSCGQVAGTFLDAGTPAFRWTPSAASRTEGSIAELSPPSGFTRSLANGINDLGAVVGLAGNPQVPALWPEGSTSGLALDVPSSASANDIDSQGRIVGGSTVIGAWLHENGTTTPLGATPSLAEAISENGKVAGNATLFGSLAAARWEAGTWTSLHPFAFTSSFANDINDAGLAVGYVFPPGESREPYAFSPGPGPLQPLVPPDELFGFAHAINDLGQIVGTSTAADGGSHAVLWAPDGSVVDLNTLVPPPPGLLLRNAYDINDAGQIVGVAVDPSETEYAFLLTPEGLAPCGAGIEITDVELFHQDFPSGDWIEIPGSGTVDGNQVRIVATIENPLGDNHEVAVDFKDPETDLHLPGGVPAAPIVIPPGGTAEVEYVWDTSGYAWDDDGAPHSNRTVRVTVVAAAPDLQDSLTTPVTVKPKPVVMVHGFLSNAGTWADYYGILSGAHPDWEGFAVGDEKAGTAGLKMDTGGILDPVTNTIVQNADVVAQYVAAVRDHVEAWHVDFVVHSMGGLISRRYIQDSMPESPDGEPVVSHLIMLGTPNHGTACAYAAPIPFPAIYELQTGYIEDIFNPAVTDRRGVPFSIAAGNPFLFTCTDPGPGDSVVSLVSATTGYDDQGLFNTIHTDMTKSLGMFGSFVEPRLALGPGEVSGLPRATGRSTAGSVQSSAAGDSLTETSPEFILRETVMVPSDAGLDIAIPVSAASRFGVTLLAPPEVGSSVDNPSGTEVDAVAPGSPTAEQPFRTSAFIAPALGEWHLHLFHDGGEPVPVSVSAWLEGSPLVLEVDALPDADGGVEVTGTLTDSGTGVPGADVSAVVRGLDGSETSLQLVGTALPRGSEAGGTYAAATGALAPGAYEVTLRAEGAGFTRIVLDSVLVESGGIVLPDDLELLLAEIDGSDLKKGFRKHLAHHVEHALKAHAKGGKHVKHACKELDKLLKDLGKKVGKKGLTQALADRWTQMVMDIKGALGC